MEMPSLRRQEAQGDLRSEDTDGAWTMGAHVGETLGGHDDPAWGCLKGLPISPSTGMLSKTFCGRVVICETGCSARVRTCSSSSRMAARASGFLRRKSRSQKAAGPMFPCNEKRPCCTIETANLGCKLNGLCHGHSPGQGAGVRRPVFPPLPNN